MNVEKLRKKGWSEEEITHALKVFKHAEETKHPHLKIIEHAVFWLLLITLLSATIAITLELIPVFLLSPVLSTTISLIFATLLGLLLIHVLHDLKLERHHQHIGVALLVTGAIISVTALLNMFETRIGTLSIGSSLMISLFFAAGFLIPYLIHWRVTHETR